MEYEQLQKYPVRLQQRGSALTKQLIKEEKMCRMLSNQGKTANTNRVNQALPNKLPCSKDVRVCNLIFLIRKED